MHFIVLLYYYYTCVVIFNESSVNYDCSRFYCDNAVICGALRVLQLVKNLVPWLNIWNLVKFFKMMHYFKECRVLSIRLCFSPFYSSNLVNNSKKLFLFMCVKLHTFFTPLLGLSNVFPVFLYFLYWYILYIYINTIMFFNAFK